MLARDCSPRGRSLRVALTRGRVSPGAFRTASVGASPCKAVPDRSAPRIALRTSRRTQSTSCSISCSIDGCRASDLLGILRIAARPNMFTRPSPNLCEIVAPVAKVRRLVAVATPSFPAPVGKPPDAHRALLGHSTVYPLSEITKEHWQRHSLVDPWVGGNRCVPAARRAWQDLPNRHVSRAIDHRDPPRLRRGGAGRQEQHFKSRTREVTLHPPGVDSSVSGHVPPED